MPWAIIGIRWMSRRAPYIPGCQRGRITAFNPANRSFSQIGNHTEASFTAAAGAESVNPLDTAEYFVRQQYSTFSGANRMKRASLTERSDNCLRGRPGLCPHAPH